MFTRAYVLIGIVGLLIAMALLAIGCTDIAKGGQGISNPLAPSTLPCMAPRACKVTITDPIERYPMVTP